MEAQFKNLKFNDEAEFNKWLAEKTYKTIYFKAQQQDLLKIHIAESGEIIHANMQASVWNGTFVNLEELKPDANIQMYNQSQQRWDIMNLIIAVIK